MSETKSRKSDKFECLNCKKTIPGDKYHEVFDELGIELGLPKLVRTYFKLDVNPDSVGRQVLCEKCLGDLINAYDVDEYNKQKSISAKQSPEKKNSTAEKAKTEEPSVVIQTSVETLPKTRSQSKRLVVVPYAKKTEQTQLPAPISVKLGTIPTAQPNASIAKRETRKRSLLRREQNDKELENILKGVINLDESESDRCTSPPKKQQTVFIVSSATNEDYVEDDLIIQETEIHLEDYKVEVSKLDNGAASHETDGPNLRDSVFDGDTHSSTRSPEERLDEFKPVDSIMEVEEDVELLEHMQLIPEDDNVDVSAYLDEAIKSDFKSLKFKWSTSCHLCSWKCETFQALFAHVCKEHSLPKDYYSCPAEDCGDQLKSKKLLARHIILKHATLDNLQIYGSCPDCQKTFSSFVVFNKHSCARPIKRRRGMCMNCEMCGIDFPSMKRFIFHMQFHLEKRRPRICFICDYANNNVEELFEHIYYEHEPTTTYACKICDRIFKNEQKFREHKHAETAEYQCSDCNKSFNNKSRLMAHVKQRHTQYFKCDTCKEEFFTTEQYREHLELHTNSAVALYTCSNCGLVCDDRDNVLDHISLVDTECSGAEIEEEVLSFAYTCEYCSLDFKSKNDLKLHRSTGIHNDGQYKCLPCNKTFCQMKLYRVHKKHTNSDWKEANICSLYMCNVDDCEETYSQWNSLYTHKRRHHFVVKAEDAEDEQEAVVTKAAKFVCQFCDKHCPTKMSLSVHVARRHNNKNVACSFCGASFKNDEALKKHVDYMHVPVACPECLKVVKNRRNYEVHERVVHMAEKRYFCTVCKKGFYHKSDKEAHAKLHEQIFSCEECDFTTNYAKSLEIHVASVHRQEFEFECHICKKKFGRKQALNTHVKRHSQIRPYHCSKVFLHGCRKKFTTQSDLTKHLRAVHGVERLDKLVNESQKTSDVEWDDEQEVYEVSREEVTEDNNDDSQDSVDDQMVVSNVQEYIVEAVDGDEQNYEFVLIKD